MHMLRWLQWQHNSLQAGTVGSKIYHIFEGINVPYVTHVDLVYLFSYAKNSFWKQKAIK